MLTLFTAVALTVIGVGEDATVIDLGGVRKASATVVRQGDDYLVTVRMHAVTSFDAGVNARVNRDKAEFYGIQAMARYLGGSNEQVTLSVSGITFKKASTSGSDYQLGMVVPSAECLLVATAPVAGKQRIAVADRSREISATALLSRKEDWQATLRSVAYMIDQDANQLVHGSARNAQAAFFGLADLEERWETASRKFLTEAKADKLLLQVEIESLAAEVELESRRVLGHLSDAATRVEASAAKETEK